MKHKRILLLNEGGHNYSYKSNITEVNEMLGEKVVIVDIINNEYLYIATQPESYRRNEYY